MNIELNSLVDKEINLWNAISFVEVCRDPSSTLKDKCEELQLILGEGRNGIDFASFADLIEEVGSRGATIDHFYKVCINKINVDFHKAIELGFIPSIYSTTEPRKHTSIQVRMFRRYC